ACPGASTEKPAAEAVREAPRATRAVKRARVAESFAQSARRDVEGVVSWLVAQNPEALFTSADVAAGAGVDSLVIVDVLEGQARAGKVERQEHEDDDEDKEPIVLFRAHLQMREPAKPATNRKGQPADGKPYCKVCKCSDEHECDLGAG